MDSQLVLDPFGYDMLANYSTSCVFMGAFGIDKTGATNNDSVLIATGRAMIEPALESVVLADSTKFDRRVGSLSSADSRKSRPSSATTGAWKLTGR
jgi:DeoR/GlpR family transcriptional regulator of sugar metabolism